MSVTLRTLLKLPEINSVRRTTQHEEFVKEFRLKIGRVNSNLQQVAAQAGKSVHKPLDDLRIKVIAAQQKALELIDPADASKAEPAIKRVLEAVDAVDQKASRAAEAVGADRNLWLELEEELDEIVQQSSELEDAGHPKAPVLRKIGEAARERAKVGKFQEAVVAVNQLRPKFQKILAGQQDEQETDVASVEAQPPAEDGQREGLTVLVKDQTTSEVIEGVSVAIGDQSDTTNAYGLATLELPVGVHDYQVTAEGYEAASDSVEIVAGDNPELVIKLVRCDLPREGLTVLVRDSETGEAVEGAVVTVGGASDVTSSNGLATLELPAGTHSYEVTAEGYAPESGDFEVVEGDNEDLVIELTYNEECEHDEEGGDEVVVGDDEEVDEDDGDLTDELADAERFIVLWDEALDNVAGQVERLREAMADADDFGARAVHDGLATVMDKFPDLNLQYLVADAKAEDQEAFEKTLQQTAGEIRQVRELLANGPLLSTIDKNPYVKTDVHATVNRVLNEIVDGLDVKIENPKPRLKLGKVKRRTRNLKKIKN